MSNHNTRQEVADHVRRIHSAYYYTAYQSLAKPSEDSEEGDVNRHGSPPGTGMPPPSSPATPVMDTTPIIKSRSGRRSGGAEDVGEGGGEGSFSLDPKSQEILQGSRCGLAFSTGEEAERVGGGGGNGGLVYRSTAMSSGRASRGIPSFSPPGGREGQPQEREEEEGGGGKAGGGGGLRWILSTAALSSASHSSLSRGMLMDAGVCGEAGIGSHGGEGEGGASPPIRGRPGEDGLMVSSSGGFFSGSHGSGFSAVDTRSGRREMSPMTDKCGCGISATSSPLSSPYTAGPCLPRAPVIVSGNGNRPLSEAVALVLGVKTHDTSVVQYESGEVHVEFHAPVMGRDVYIIQSTGGNNVVDTNTAILEILLLIRKLRLQFAKSITAIIPFLGYSTQDCKRHLRGGFGAAVVAKMITQMGVDRVATLDLHSHQSQGYFENTPLDTLVMVYEFNKYFRAQPWFAPERVAVVAPDARAVLRARQLADVLNVSQIVTILRRRVVRPPTPGCGGGAGVGGAGAGETACFAPQTVLETAGSVEGLYCIVVDDMMDTGLTIIQACDLLHQMGATSISACCTHGLLSSPAETRIMRCESLTEVIVSDSIPQEEHQQRIPKLKVVSIAPLLASVIRMYEKGRSLAPLFP